MPRKCTICGHKKRGEIDKALLTCEPYRGIAERFHVSGSALLRHKRHIPLSLIKAKGLEDQLHADSLLEGLLALNVETLGILREARDTKNHDLALKAIARAEKQIELQSKFLSDLNATPVLNVLVSQEWLKLRDVILKTLEPYTEAKLKLAEVLQRI